MRNVEDAGFGHKAAVKSVEGRMQAGSLEELVGNMMLFKDVSWVPFLFKIIVVVWHFRLGPHYTHKILAASFLLFSSAPECLALEILELKLLPLLILGSSKEIPHEPSHHLQTSSLLPSPNTFKPFQK